MTLVMFLMQNQELAVSISSTYVYDILLFSWKVTCNPTPQMKC